MRLSPVIFLNEGDTRAVYSHGVGFVLKVPKDEFGVDANAMEAAISQRWGRRPDPHGIVYARCRLLRNGWLVMERVETKITDYPRWAGLVDCHQVGRTQSGRIVAYDYGSEVMYAQVPV